MLLVPSQVIYASLWCQSPVIYTESAPCCGTFSGQEGGGIEGLSPRPQVLFGPAAAGFLSGTITAARVSYIGERRSYILTVHTNISRRELILMIHLTTKVRTYILLCVNVNSSDSIILQGYPKWAVPLKWKYLMCSFRDLFCTKLQYEIYRTSYQLHVLPFQCKIQLDLIAQCHKHLQALISRDRNKCK